MLAFPYLRSRFGEAYSCYHAVHILEYENYSGYDKTTQKIKNSEVTSILICS